jgi:hypothetical protein
MVWASDSEDLRAYRTMALPSLSSTFCFVALLGAVYTGATQVGYTDTPMIPGTKWRVHDANRIPPRAVVAGEHGTAPSDAAILFDGTNLDQWKGGPWKLVDGAMEVNGTGTIETKQVFGDCQLHVEWATPEKFNAESQGRSNSGIFLMGRYEVQVLDSFENRTYADGQASSLYGQTPPLVNATRPPGEWQSYDIIFEAPHFEEGKLVEPAYVTVLHNGVVTHHRKAFTGATTHKAVASYKEHGEGPIRLQDHGNPVRFRNIWIRQIGEYDQDN